MYGEDPAHNKVLVVDDELPVRRALTKILQKGGYECRAAASNEEAKTLLKSEPFAVLITDMRMYGEEGLELLRYVGDRYPDVATVMVTGQTEEDLERAALQSGASHFIRKPYDADELLASIQDTFEKREEAIKLRKHKTW